MNIPRLKLPRLIWCGIVAVLMLIVLYAIAPHRMELALYKISFVPLAGVVAYWVCRELFPHLRPSDCLEPKDTNGFRAIRHGCERRYLFAVSVQVAVCIAGMICMAVGL